MFDKRADLQAAGIHRPGQAGISGGADGADSIVISGGYVEDIDCGTEVIYTGHGGRDPRTKQQIAHQELTVGNLGLAQSRLNQFPVRVVRGAQGNPKYSPKSGYRYDGLYEVVEHWYAVGQNGFKVWRFRLLKLADDLPADDTEIADGISRTKTVINRQNRNILLVKEVKDLHDNTCQFCGIRLITSTGAVSQAAHIRPLGTAHNGPDEIENLLCLCPNDHILFDYGAIHVNEHEQVTRMANPTVTTPLRRADGHYPAERHFKYHREHIV